MSEYLIDKFRRTLKDLIDLDGMMVKQYRNVFLCPDCKERYKKLNINQDELLGNARYVGFEDAGIYVCKCGHCVIIASETEENDAGD